MRPKRVLGFLGTMGLLFAVVSFAQTQATPLSVLEESAPARPREVPAQAKPDSAIEGRLSARLFEARTLSVSLGDRQLILYKTVPSVADTWSGRSADGRAEATFTRYKGVVVGTIRDGSEVWEVRPASHMGNTLIYQLDSAKLPEEGPLRRPPGG